MLTWIVGRGGLLGSAVVRATGTKFTARPVPWENHDAAADVLDSDLEGFIRAAGNDDWSVIWAAGSGVVGTSTDKLAADTRIVSTCLRGSGTRGQPVGAPYSSRPPQEVSMPGRLIHRSVSRDATSAESVRRNETRSRGDPAHDTRKPHPIVIGRFSNLAGPGQNLVKQQGLVSQLCRAVVQRQSLNVFVPMETLRDYLDVDDAAAMVRTLVEDAVQKQPSAPVLRNIASQRPVSVCAVVRTVQQVAPAGFASDSGPARPRNITSATCGFAHSSRTSFGASHPPGDGQRVYDDYCTAIAST